MAAFTARRHETRALLRAHLAAASGYRHLTRHCPICHRLLRLAMEPSEPDPEPDPEGDADPGRRSDRDIDPDPDIGRTHDRRPERDPAHDPEPVRRPGPKVPPLSDFGPMPDGPESDTLDIGKGSKV